MHTFCAVVVAERVKHVARTQVHIFTGQSQDRTSNDVEKEKKK